MAKSINQVLLMGNLTADPEVRQVADTSVAEFSLALNREYTKNGEAMSVVDYIDVTAWGKLGELCGQYLQKGSRALVSGRFQKDVWEVKETGKKASKIIVVAEDVTFLDGRSSDD